MFRSNVQISSEPIDLNRVYLTLNDPAAGAQLMFVGTVRNRNDGRSVHAVTYEAFEPLAHRVGEEILQEAHAACGPIVIGCLLHRTGPLAVGQVSTVIGVSAAHRDAAYKASRYIIEQVKLRLPVWKEEHYVGGESCWLAGQKLEADDSDRDPGRG